MVSVGCLGGGDDVAERASVDPADHADPREPGQQTIVDHAAGGIDPLRRDQKQLPVAERHQQPACCGDLAGGEHRAERHGDGRGRSCVGDALVMDRPRSGRRRAFQFAGGVGRARPALHDARHRRAGKCCRDRRRLITGLEEIVLREGHAGTQCGMPRDLRPWRQACLMLKGRTDGRDWGIARRTGARHHGVSHSDLLAESVMVRLLGGVRAPPVAAL
ncbi:hypothetical protein SI859A1_02304 [Aurantimonas manganoxydans SI85-9A1]|uniref:Uncharacterized protein n=1 Tax=Aurantimonas manganoxydans (strain ATCC BAA-1229 / DSM 21871 / SI85-9A1) TaxID=287752 RepID=Q1YM93_AURMS|nr:hypothetical protein SI859A1_02304 [Aurantimonas manganoxydans SI85-9A1]